MAGGHGEEALQVCGVVFFRLFGDRPSDPSKVKSCRARHPRSARFHPSCWLIFPLLDPASSQVASCDGVKRLSVSGRVRPERLGAGYRFDGRLASLDPAGSSHSAAAAAASRSLLHASLPS